MFTREDLCSLKSRKISCMRKNVYGIFRALRHFGVSEKEVEKIANAYKTWLSFPIEEKSPYNWVYYLNSRLISMPIEIKQLEEHLIGYAVGNKVFSVAQGEKIAKDNIEDSIQLLKQELDKRMLGADGNADLQVHLPTKEEAEYFFTTFADNWLANVAATAGVIYAQLPDGDDCELQFPINNQIPNMWITPDADEPEMTAVKMGINNSGPYCKKYRPNSRTKSAVCLITDLRDGDFIGKLTKYGTPTQATIEMFYELLEKRC